MTLVRNASIYTIALQPLRSQADVQDAERSLNFNLKKHTMTNKKDPFNHPFFTDTEAFVKREKRKWIAFFIIFIAVMIFLLHKLSVSIDEYDKSIKELVGKQVVIGKDTLTVIDYSTLQKTYKLSNGIDYNMDFIKSKTIK